MTVGNNIPRPSTCYKNMTLNEKYPSALLSSTAEQKASFSYDSMLFMGIIFYK